MHISARQGKRLPCPREGKFAMRQKPRWMRSVIEAAKAEQPPLPLGRNATGMKAREKPDSKTVFAKA